MTPRPVRTVAFPSHRPRPNPPPLKRGGNSTRFSGDSCEWERVTKTLNGSGSAFQDGSVGAGGWWWDLTGCETLQTASTERGLNAQVGTPWWMQAVRFRPACRLQAAASQMVTVSYISAAALAVTSPEWLLLGSKNQRRRRRRRKKNVYSYWAHFSSKAFALLTQNQTLVTSGGEFIPFCSLPVSQSGLRLPVDPSHSRRWDGGERRKPGIRHHK